MLRYIADIGQEQQIISDNSMTIADSQRSELETKDNRRYDEKQQILIDVTRQLADAISYQVAAENNRY